MLLEHRESERTQLIAQLADVLGVQLPPTPPPAYRPMTWSQIKEVAANGIEIGSHTCSHPRLSLATDDELVSEIAGSRRRLEDITGKSVTSFCYPFGQREDLDARARSAVAAAGYSHAVVAYHDERALQDLFAIRRFGVGTNRRQFRDAVTGIDIALSRLRPQSDSA